jgi:atypical dual specificity phosphatase
MTSQEPERQQLSLFHRIFDKLYPVIRFSHERLRGNAWFTQILPELWLGGAPTYERDHEVMLKSGITAVLDTRQERIGDLRFYERHGMTHAKIGVPDVTVPDAETISAGVDWVAEQIADGRTVLVHCAKGRGRSATVVAAYLMREKGMTYDEARRMMNSKRPLTNLEPKHRKVLERWIAAQEGVPGAPSARASAHDNSIPKP